MYITKHFSIIIIIIIFLASSCSKSNKELISTITDSKQDAPVAQVIDIDYERVLSGVWSTIPSPVSNGYSDVFSWGESYFDSNTIVIDLISSTKIIKTDIGRFTISSISVDKDNSRIISILPVWDNGKSLAANLVIQIVDKQNIRFLGENETISTFSLFKNKTYYKVNGYEHL